MKKKNIDIPFHGRVEISEKEKNHYYINIRNAYFNNILLIEAEINKLIIYLEKNYTYYL